MKKEYDFSKGVRGKFHKVSAKFNLPVYLDNEIQDFIGRNGAGKSKARQQTLDRGQAQSYSLTQV